MTTGPGLIQAVVAGRLKSSPKSPADAHTLREKDATPTPDAAARAGGCRHHREQDPNRLGEARGHREQQNAHELDARVEALHETRTRRDLVVLEYLDRGVPNRVGSPAGKGATTSAMGARILAEMCERRNHADAPGAPVGPLRSLRARSLAMPHVTPTTSAAPISAAKR